MIQGDSVISGYTALFHCLDKQLSQRISWDTYDRRHRPEGEEKLKVNAVPAKFE